MLYADEIFMLISECAPSSPPLLQLFRIHRDTYLSSIKWDGPLFVFTVRGSWLLSTRRNDGWNELFEMGVGRGVEKGLYAALSENGMGVWLLQCWKGCLRWVIERGGNWTIWRRNLFSSLIKHNSFSSYTVLSSLNSSIYNRFCSETNAPVQIP